MKRKDHEELLNRIESALSLADDIAEPGDLKMGRIGIQLQDAADLCRKSLAEFSSETGTESSR